MATQKEREALRLLAHRWMEYALSPLIKERKRQWKALKDLKMEKPMILVETCMLPDYVAEDELVCIDPYLRKVEKTMREILKHADEIGDDIVVDPYFRVPWSITISDYGIPMEAHHAMDSSGRDLAYTYDFGLRNQEDFKKLHLREKSVDRKETMARAGILAEIMGDILPILVGGYDNFNQEPGYHPWLGNYYCGLTMNLYKLVGNDNLLYWVYDDPDLVEKIMDLICRDRIDQYQWMEEQELFYTNTDMYNPCPCSYGYVSGLRDAEFSGKTRMKDCWAWIDSQESEPISPAMFAELFLPHMARLCNQFGLTYYGCCERIDDRFEYIEKAITNLRAVSVSGWSNFYKMGEMLGKKYVYSRKPTPAYISGESADWQLLKKDVKDTLQAAGGCNLEFCFRDIYTVNGDHGRLKKWVAMTRSMMNA